ncbi:MAG TPA: tripartite tricarboxylate transporter substrate-binding protein, partial [Candidatus Binatia bacterium]
RAGCVASVRFSFTGKLEMVMSEARVMNIDLACSRAVVFFLTFGVFNLLSVSSVQAQADPFYKGKQIRIVTGATAGGFYDRWARLLARAMPKYIPGQPDIIVQNMPGGGSLVAANYVYGVAKPDGLTTLMPNSNVYLEQLSGHKEVRFDLRKFPILGSQEKNYMLLYMRADAPYKTIGDIIKAKEPPKCGSTGVGSAGYILDRILEVALGAKINTVMGYPGGNEIDLAVEKGEVHCRGNTILPHFGREPFDTWHKKGFDRHLIQTTRKRDPVVPEAPTIYELMDQYKTTESNRRLANVLLSGAEFGRFMLVTPGTPPDRVKMLREAYAKSMKDPELIAEAKKGRMDMDPSTGEELQTLVQEIMDQPPDVIERMKKILSE